MLLLGRCSVGIGGSSIGFLFSIRCKIPIYPVIEWWPIVGYNRLRYLEPTHNVLPYELKNLFIFDGCKSFGFYQFTEIVGGNQY